MARFIIFITLLGTLFFLSCSIHSPDFDSDITPDDTTGDDTTTVEDPQMKELQESMDKALEMIGSVETFSKHENVDIEENDKNRTISINIAYVNEDMTEMKWLKSDSSVSNSEAIKNKSENKSLITTADVYTLAKNHPITDVMYLDNKVDFTKLDYTIYEATNTKKIYSENGSDFEYNNTDDIEPYYYLIKKDCVNNLFLILATYSGLGNSIDINTDLENIAIVDETTLYFY